MTTKKSGMTSKYKKSIASVLTIGSIAQSMILMPTSKAHAQTTGAIERPPQFVLLAFDGSKSNPMWRETQEFARQMDMRGKHVRFTYFINSAYYVKSCAGDSTSTSCVAANLGYRARNKAAGRSAIGWGADTSDVLSRMQETKRANDAGHEIASHAVGHFNAENDRWTQEDWRSEFSFMNNFLLNFFTVNSIAVVSSIQSWLSDLVKFQGFRAPELGKTPGLFQTLREFDFRYDTSKSQGPQSGTGMYPWPSKNPDAGGFWDFALNEIPYLGDRVPARDAQGNPIYLGKRNGSRIHSMDYNFYANQGLVWDDVGGGQLRLRTNANGSPVSLNPVPAEYLPGMERAMLDSYNAYFANSYNGNRSPIHIGHHFSKWNGGIYWTAMKKFADSVCGLPEVKCVTYSELADFMDDAEQVPGMLAALNRGNFPRGVRTNLAANVQRTGSSADVQLAFNSDRQFLATMTGSTAARTGARTEFMVNNRVMRGSSLSLESVRGVVGRGNNADVVARIVDRGGRELSRQTLRMLNVGTATEAIAEETLEDRLNAFDPAEAHFEHDPAEHSHPAPTLQFRPTFERNPTIRFDELMRRGVGN